MEEEIAPSSETAASQAQDKSESKSSETPVEETTDDKSMKTPEKEADDCQNSTSEPPPQEPDVSTEPPQEVSTEPQEVYTEPQDVSFDQERQQSVPVIQIEEEEVGNENANQNNDMIDQQKSVHEPSAAATSITPVPGETDIGAQSRKLDGEEGLNEVKDDTTNEGQNNEKGDKEEQNDEQEVEKHEDEQAGNNTAAGLDDISEEASEVESEEESEEEFDRDEAIEHYKDLLTEYEKNQTHHSHLQHKIAEYLAKKKADEKPDPGRNVADQEQRFQKCMESIDQLHIEAKNLQCEFETEEAHLKNQQAIKQEEMDKAWKEFKVYVTDKSVAAVHSRTGRKLGPQEVEQYLGMLERKDKDVIQVRLENVKLQNRINKLEALIQEKEQLAEGLHMIDFEQLRINNVDLNEKIEDRNEEIHKLQKKVTSTVQVLAHLKEKLQFVQVQNMGKEAQLRELDQEVAKNRDALNRLKHAKDAIRSENTQLKQNGGLLSHPVLLKNFEEQIDMRKSMQARLEDIQLRHSELTLTCNKLKLKIDQARSLPL